MTTDSKDAKARAEANFKKKQDQAREGAQAWKEYQEQGQATRDKTARLRSLRLAKEAADRQAAIKTEKKTAVT